jgi:coproporphyrinogen III oxidase-like Fe-S oxidoreductase
MLLETALTAYLRRKYAAILQLEEFGAIAPPAPAADQRYLIYVHVPFCEELCPYCSFNRVPLDMELAHAYFDALDQEIRIYRDLGFSFNAVYVGGGTPTVAPERLAALLGGLKAQFPIRQISVETNPNHLNEEIVTLLQDAGVNRLSVGVQSFDNSLLDKMERRHKYGSGEQIREKLQRYTGAFDTLNVDMIFNFPGQTIEMLDKDLDIIQEFNADQATFYPLMVSDVTRQKMADVFGGVSLRQERVLFNRIADRLKEKYRPGTAWCFSRKKSMIDEYIVEHDEYVGVGSGAFGYVNGSVLADAFSIPRYVSALRQGKLPLQARKQFSLKDQIRYEFVMKLFGMSLDLQASESKFHGRFRKSLRKEIGFLELAGAITNENGRLRLTRRGQYLWVVMMREFFTGVNNFRDACRARID